MKKPFSGWTLSLILLISVPVSQADAQRLIERDKMLNPLENPAVELEADQTSWLTQFGGWGAFGSQVLSRDSDHLWYQELGAYAEIYRRGNRTSLAITSQIEFIADDSNDINFSPRAIFWEEGLLLTRSFDSFTLQAGYYHRCKHDIDNLDTGQERTQVFGSALARVIFPFTLYKKNDARFSVQYDHYTIAWEDRVPEAFEQLKPRWDQLQSSIKLNSAWKIQVGRTANLYLDGYSMATIFEEDIYYLGKFRVELGRSQQAGDIRFGIHIEHLADSGIPVQPKSVTLAGFGVRIMTIGSVSL
ncbi:hypothetical protein DYD21_12025 [Rhodohalobacter sp. SW132]|uniref:hypothetical protein n=1 Tax=Rhodohalobacter sp. SW132 TaxID=2293433 RepID=UPI000E225757|nr:hypothetical protein [Rhodohalobacter sp. SW132]REL33489.1 hypothetical protein DYD21_12025 [Rhodohalobacter sp. SW132]